MKKNIAIIGAGGFGRETACCLRAINGESPSWNLIGFFDDGVAAGTENEYGRVLGTVEDLNAWKEPLSVVIAIASPRALERISGLLDNPLLDFPNIIAPDVKFYDRGRVAMGKGNVISFGHIFSCHVDMGDFNMFSCGSLIGHDVTLGNWNVVANGCKVSGGVTLGKRRPGRQFHPGPGCAGGRHLCGLSRRAEKEAVPCAGEEIHRLAVPGLHGGGGGKVRA